MSTRTAYCLPVLVAFMLLTACSVQKRHYLKGFHVEWKKGRPASEITRIVSPRERPDETPAPFLSSAEPVTASTGNGDGMAVLHVKEPRPLIPEKRQDCDLLLMRTGEEHRVKIIEITPDLIKYRRCDNLDGPLYSVKKRDVFSITYANGVKEVIEAPPEQPVQTSSPRPSGRRPLMGTAAGAFVVSMLGAFYSLYPDSTGLAVLLLVMGLVLSIRALVRLGKKPEYRGKGFTVAAFVISVVFGLLLLLVVTA